ncbi:MAG: hypothetical protein WBW98_08500 [Candidatus Sulfotelmatobacter sp.]
MRRDRLIFAFFAAAILFSMVREWSAPASCARALLILPAAAQP